MVRKCALFMTLIMLAPVLLLAQGKSEPKLLRITGESWHIQKIFIEDAAKRFMKDHPDVKIEVMPYAEASVVTNYAIDWSRGKTPVDIVIVAGAQFSSQFIGRNLIYDFDRDLNFFGGEYPKEAFVPVGLENGKILGNQYVLPLMIEAYAVVVNKAMFRKAGLLDSKGEPLVPKTWQEFYEFAKKLHIVQNGQIVQQGATLQWSTLNTYATLLGVLRAARGTIFGPDGSSVSFDNPEFREILKIWKKGADEGVFSKEMYGDHFAGNNSFKAGKLAMLLDSGGRWMEGAQVHGKQNVSVIPFPGADTGGSYGFGSGVIIPRASPAPKLALQFIREQLLGEYVQTNTVNVYGKMPAISKYYEKAADAQWLTLKKIAAASGAPPTYKEFAKFQKGLSPILQNYLDGKLSLDEAIEAFEKHMASIDKSML